MLTFYLSAFILSSSWAQRPAEGVFASISRQMDLAMTAGGSSFPVFEKVMFTLITERQSYRACGSARNPVESPSR